MEVVSSLWFNAQFAIERAPLVLRLKKLEGQILRPHIQIDFENEFYQVKTVNNFDELVQVLKLRFEVFFREFSSQKVHRLIPYDVDIHDFTCDHLIVKDKSSQQVIACYRLMSSRNHSTFYSESEFDLSILKQMSGTKLELGRACVHKDYRKGAVISLLWKGLIDYARKSETRYMFGCSSINRSDFSHLSKIIQYIERQDAFLKDFTIDVLPKYRINFPIEESHSDSCGRPINSLMHMYLLAGAKMGRTLAYDKEMDCLDMFTLMDMEKLPSSFERRFA
jgi:putative hemolysin